MTRRREFTSRFIFVGTGFSRDLYMILEKGLKTSIRGFCQIAGGNQGANTAVRPLEPHGAPRITLDPQVKN